MAESKPNQPRRHKTPHPPDKLRQGLAMESYNKDLEFPADGPGRVIVRLERLMGSDRIRITDAKYMATLLQRLEEEEERTWFKRTRERRKAEHNRFRQLAIDGYTEPGPGMEDLYQHPVFRVNRILNRLSKLDSSLVPVLNLPSIIPTEPFSYDDTGRVFKSYPGHLAFVKRGTEYYIDDDNLDVKLNMEQIVYVDNLMEAGENEEEAEDNMINESEGADLELYESPSENETFLHPNEIGAAGGLHDDEPRPASPTRMLTLHEIQQKYGVAPNTDLGVQWRPYQSTFVSGMFHDEQRGVWDLYEMGKDVVGMYDRQQETTDEYLAAIRAGKAQAFFKRRRKLMYDAATYGDEDEEEEGNSSEEELDTNLKQNKSKGIPKLLVQSAVEVETSNPRKSARMSLTKEAVEEILNNGTEE